MAFRILVFKAIPPYFARLKTGIRNGCRGGYLCKNGQDNVVQILLHIDSCEIGGMFAGGGCFFWMRATPSF